MSENFLITNICFISSIFLATEVPKVQISFQDQEFDSSIGLNLIQGNKDEVKTVTCMVKHAFPLPEVYINIKSYDNSILTTIQTADLTIQSMLESDNTYSGILLDPCCSKRGFNASA